MNRKINIEGYSCEIIEQEESENKSLTYMIYPALEQLPLEWLRKTVASIKQSICVIYVPAEKWNDALTPWPEPGEAKGCQPFAGKAEEFLAIIKTNIIPEVEGKLSYKVEKRNLSGVSLGGLFTLWQWLICDLFDSIACLSGSFWYIGFMEWFNEHKNIRKEGTAYFLLGEEEPHSSVKAFQSVGENTLQIVSDLTASGIDVTFEWVPGNHFSRPLHRAERALTAISQSQVS